MIKNLYGILKLYNVKYVQINLLPGIHHLINVLHVHDNYPYIIIQRLNVTNFIVDNLKNGIKFFINALI